MSEDGGKRDFDGDAADNRKHDGDRDPDSDGIELDGLYDLAQTATTFEAST